MLARVPVTRIATPDDLGATLGVPFTAHEWLSPPFRAERALRDALEDLFGVPEALTAPEPARVGAYLEGAAEALRAIAALRCGLVAVAGNGLTRYIVAPETCLFQVSESPVHLLGADCEAAVEAVIAGGPFRWWGAPSLAAGAFPARRAPWCPRCLEAAADEAAAPG